MAGGVAAAAVLSADISRRNPQDEYELVQRIGSGTYGDVYKVSISLKKILFIVLRSLYTVSIRLFLFV